MREPDRLDHAARSIDLTVLSFRTSDLEPAPGLEPGTARLQGGCYPLHPAPTSNSSHSAAPTRCLKPLGLTPFRVTNDVTLPMERRRAPRVTSDHPGPSWSRAQGTAGGIPSGASRSEMVDFVIVGTGRTRRGTDHRRYRRPVLDPAGSDPYLPIPQLVDQRRRSRRGGEHAA
jgi:hypothetical protein